MSHSKISFFSRAVYLATPLLLLTVPSSHGAGSGSGSKQGSKKAVQSQGAWFLTRTRRTLFPKIGKQKAPDFALSGRAAELQKVVLAEDADGAITALDTLIYLDMSRNPAVHTPVDQWLASEDKRDPGAWKAIQGAVEEFLAVRSLARQGKARNVSAFERRSLLDSGAETAWVEQVVMPQIAASGISDADVNRYHIFHPEKYSSKARAQVRYIYLTVADMTEAAQVREAQDKMAEIRGKIVGGELKFEDAAAQFSKAPSASQGGLIPEFARGEHVAEFDYQTFALKRPGDLSPVFVGADGVFLIQLVSRKEETKTPVKDVEGEIRLALGRELIPHYYRFLLNQTTSRRYTQNIAALWGYADLAAPVAWAGDFKLTRDDLMRINPSAVNARFEPQVSVIQQETENWIEGETILRDLEKRGQGNHPYLVQAGKIADALLNARQILTDRVEWSKVSTKEAAMKTLAGGQGDVATGIRESRVVQISVIPFKGTLAQAGEAEVLRAGVNQICEQIAKGELPTRPEPTPFADDLVEAAQKGDDALTAEIETLKRRMAQSPWTHIQIRIQDVGWKDSAPLLAWQAPLVELKPGGISPPQPVGDTREIFFVASTRINPKNQWLDAPLVFQCLAYDYLRDQLLEDEVKKVQGMNLLKFKRVGGT